MELTRPSSIFWQKEQIPLATSCFCDPASHKLWNVIFKLEDRTAQLYSEEQGMQTYLQKPSLIGFLMPLLREMMGKQNLKSPCTSGHSKKNNNNIISKTRFCHRGAN